jgi:hypothetical protein
MNWIIACGYGTAGIACALRGLQRAEPAWIGAAAALCLLALVQATQLDLVATSALRSAASREGWYVLRRPAQAVALGAGALALFTAAQRLRSQPLLAAGLGMCLLLGWARVVSLHQVDAILNARVSGLSTGRWIDMGALALVAAACLWPGERHA